jgi:hypothetical protein
VRHRQLEHRGLPGLFQKGQKHDLPIREFEGVVMDAKDFLIELT